MEFEQNCYHIGGVDTSPLKSVAVIFNLTVLLKPFLTVPTSSEDLYNAP